MTLEQLYSKLPKLECKKLCADYCGPVPMTDEERAAMVRVFGSEPKLDGLTCGALCKLTGTCNAYEARPFVCRMWGLVPRLRCPHGCKPERELSAKEERELMSAYMKMRPNAPEMFAPRQLINQSL